MAGVSVNGKVVVEKAEKAGDVTFVWYTDEAEYVDFVKSLYRLGGTRSWDNWEGIIGGETHRGILMLSYTGDEVVYLFGDGPPVRKTFIGHSLRHPFYLVRT